MAGGEHKAQEIVANSIVERGNEIWLRRSLLNLELVTELLVLSFSSFLRRKRSIARCFAAAMSQAPGFPGCPSWAFIER